MNAIRDDFYDKVAATYQSIEASVLNSVLSDNGIADPELRRTIIAAFLFQQGVALDQGWFIEDGKKYYPGVYFSSASHLELENATLLVPGPEFGTNFHDYAFGAADWALENQGKVVVETGTD